MEDPDERVRLVKRIERFDRNSPEFIRGVQSPSGCPLPHDYACKGRVDDVRISEEMIRLCSKLAVEVCVAGHRADILMRKVALCIASLEKRKTVIKEDVDNAADLVLFHRARMPPPLSPHKHEEKEKPHEESPEDEKDQEKERAERGDSETGETRDEEEKRGGGISEKRKGVCPTSRYLRLSCPWEIPLRSKRFRSIEIAN